MENEARIFMRLAIERASKSPEAGAKVGTVLVSANGTVVTGYKGEDGLTTHAEVVALAKAEENHVLLQEGTAFVTLEPCSNLDSNRRCCADRLVEAGLGTVYIGRYDRNPQIHRLGWKALTDQGVRCLDFDSDSRTQLDTLGAKFDGFFLRRTGVTGRAKFDHLQNGGRYELSLGDDSPAFWTVEFTTKGSRSVYAYGGSPGNVAKARFATCFDQIDDPDAYDYAGSSAELEVGEIAIYRNQHGHALVQLVEVEAAPPYGDGPHTSVKFDYELRAFDP